MEKKPTATTSSKAPQVHTGKKAVKKGDAFRYKRSGTIVYVTLVLSDGIVDVQERTSQAEFPDKSPIPPRAWSAVSLDNLEPVEVP